jgi:uncharacterized protein (TIGR01777 family)
VSSYFARRGWEVIVLSRRAGAAGTIAWDGRTLGPWAQEIDGADVVLNLAGRSVNCRYTAANRAEILRSRVESTQVIGEAIRRAPRPPRVWLNSSTATIYRHAEDRPQDETTGEIGSGFSIDVATAWEKAFFDSATPPSVRKVAMRSAMVMGEGVGGPFNVFHTLARLRLGGRMGSGRQYVSWVHILDFCRAIEFLIERDDLCGVVNIASPHPLPNRAFMRDLRRAIDVRIGLPATQWMLEIGAFILRTETELPLKSRFVVPRRLLEAGFTFLHPDWPEAAADLVRSGGNTMNHKTLHRIGTLLAVLVACVWIYHGVYAKLLALGPRHMLIILSMPGVDAAVAMTLLYLVGAGELLIALWVLSGLAPRTCAVVQTVLLLSMNAAELAWARQHLLWPAGLMPANALFLAVAWVAAGLRSDTIGGSL